MNRYAPGDNYIQRKENFINSFSSLFAEPKANQYQRGAGAEEVMVSNCF